MAVNVVLNGVTYSIPEPGDNAWGESLSNYLIAQGTGLLQKSGGTFTLTAEVNFGATYGLKTAYYKSQTASPADAGQIRFARADLIQWRNQAGDGNNTLGVNSSNLLVYNGTAIQPSGSYITALTGDGTAAGPGSAAFTLATVNSSVGSFSPAAITVNAKGLVTAASSLTTGNLTAVGTDGIAITSGTGVVFGSGTSIAQHVADSTHNGYLSSTDWSTFNGKQASGSYITGLTGDATASGPGSAALTFATVNSNVGSFTNASITVNAKGLITAASSGASTAPVSRQQVFTSSGTFTKPATITSTTVVKITSIGGGGAGRSGIGNTGVGGSGGGGGGGTSITWVAGSGIGATETVTIGAGATSDGGSGGTTSAGTLSVATGGSGGGAATTTLGGAGGASGVGTTGTINFKGSEGGAGQFGTAGVINGGGGSGGVSSMGGGGQGGAGGAGTGPGQSAGNYGAGGGGGSGAGTYGNGSGGIVIFEWSG